MRIVCPHCGERQVDEFLPYGAAGLKRPDETASMSGWVDYVYLRDNKAGVHGELFYHVGGCRAWLVVTRDTRTHAIAQVVAASDQRDAAR